MIAAEGVDLAAGMADRRREIKRGCRRTVRRSGERRLFDDGKERIQLAEGIGNEQSLCEESKSNVIQS
jgi:hypothetical protein